jgi:N4-gp56 family major capsid protein
MPFTTNLSGTAQVDDSIILAYDKQFIVASAQDQIMDQFVTYKANINAKSIEFEKYSQLSLATTPLVETDDVVSEALADANIILTPAEYGNVVTKTQLASLQTGGKIDLASARLVGINAGRTQDKLALLSLDASSNVQFAGTGNGANGDLAVTDIVDTSFLNKMYNKLARNSVQMINGLYVAVLHDDAIHDLRNSAGSGSWVDINKYAQPNEVLMNEVGMLCGFRIIRDNHATIFAGASGDSEDVYNSYFMGFNALGKAVSKEVGMVATGPFDKLNRFVNLGWYGVFKYGIIDQDALYIGRSCSSLSA